MKNNKMVKYEGNIFQKIWSEIKKFFSKNETDEKNEIENQGNNMIVEKEPLTKFEKMMKFNNISNLIERYEANEIAEDDLSEEELNDLAEYYEYRNEEIDKEIKERQNEYNMLTEKLNKLRANN